MDFNQLKYYLTLEKHKHFTLAADELCISQSSLSKQIKSLEQELGVELLQRTTRNIQLTSFGEEFVVFSQKALQVYQEMHTKLEKQIGQAQQQIRIGAVPVMNQHGITALIAAFQKKHPYIHIDIVQKKTKELIYLLKSGEIDVAFIITDSVNKTGFKTYPIMVDELVLATALQHPLAQCQTVSFADIANEQFVFFDSASGMHEATIAACKQAGFIPNIIYECTQIDTVIELVSAGIGVAFLMDKIAGYYNNPKIRILHFETSIMGTTVLAIRPKEKLSASMAAFRGFALEWAKQSMISSNPVQSKA